MARPKKTLDQYSREYAAPLFEIAIGTPMRTISRRYHIGLSIVMRLKKKFF